MKRTIGWILLICGLLSFLGGFMSTHEPAPSVKIAGIILKIIMIIGGANMAFSGKPNEKQNVNNENSQSLKKGDDPKHYTFMAKQIEGYDQLPAELTNLNKINSFKEYAIKLKADPKFNREKLGQIEQFFIPDDISLFKMSVNQKYYSNTYDSTTGKFVCPTLKFFVDTHGAKSLVYPSWFYWAYADVAKWFIKGEGNAIIKSEFKEKLNYLAKISEEQLLQDFLTSEIYEDHANENKNSKIKDEHLRELIDVYKRHHPNLALECESEV